MSKPTYDDLTHRVEQFRALQLPGQPMMMHIGTLTLVNDLHAALLEARAALAKAEATATQPVAHAYVVDGECEEIQWGGIADYPDDPALVWLFAHPAPTAGGDDD